MFPFLSSLFLHTSCCWFTLGCLGDGQTDRQASSGFKCQQAVCCLMHCESETWDINAKTVIIAGESSSRTLYLEPPPLA